MAKRSRDILHNYKAGFITEQDFIRISILFENLVLNCAQSQCSELINLHNYTIRKDVVKIKRELCSKKNSPFLFVNCLN